MGTRIASGLLTLVSLFAIAGCGGDGGGAGSSYFTVLEFEPDGTTGTVARDQPLRFRFSAPVDPRSVSVHGLHLRIGEDVVPGRIEIERDEIQWFPVVLAGDRNDYVPDNLPPINALGFRARSKITVVMIGNSVSSIRSTRGKPLSETFQTSFTTGTHFLPENPPVAPSLRAETPIEFDPPPLVPGDPWSEDPEDWPVLDPADAGFTVYFSEPIHPATLDPLETITVRNISEIESPPVDFAEPALLEIRQAPEADRVEVRSMVSLGDDPTSASPYHFEVHLSDAITDLSRNHLPESIKFHFRTCDAPGEPNFTIFTEQFDTQENADTANTSAIWGGGTLLGAVVEMRETQWNPPEHNFNLPHPLVEEGNPTTPFGCRFQMKFEEYQVQSLPGESIIGMSWSPRSSYVFASTYRNVMLRLGHFSGRSFDSLGPEFDGNYLPAPANPVTVFQGNYALENDVDREWVEWPEFIRDFDYDGRHPLLIEFDMPEGGDTYQLFRCRYTPMTGILTRAFANGGEGSAPWTLMDFTRYCQRFVLVSKRSSAQSVPIGTVRSNPDFEAFNLHVDPERPTTAVRVSWAGWQGPLLTEFSEDVDSADGFPEFLFRIELVADPTTGVPPAVLHLRIAYTEGGNEG